MSAVKISVCISVHNTGSYLTRCLKSIENQTYKGIEIILVNNGSTDSSLEIMNVYAEQYPNVHVYSQVDMGLAQGRQTGVRHATGDYITFLDADDFIVPTAYEKVVNVISEFAPDIVEFSTNRNGHLLASGFSGLYSAKQILLEYFDGALIQSMLWLRVYRRKLFDKEVFPRAYINNEDIFALPCILSQAETIFFMNESLHVYSVDNEGAEMYKMDRLKYDDVKLWEIRKKAFSVVKHVEDFIGMEEIQHRYSDEFRNYICRNITYFCVAKYKKICTDKIVDFILNEMGISEKELNRYFRNNITRPVLFEKIAKCVGVRYAIPVYRSLKGLQV